MLSGLSTVEIPNMKSVTNINVNNRIHFSKKKIVFIGDFNQHSSTIIVWGGFHKCRKKHDSALVLCCKKIVQLSHRI